MKCHLLTCFLVVLLGSTWLTNVTAVADIGNCWPTCPSRIMKKVVSTDVKVSKKTRGKVMGIHKHNTVAHGAKKKHAGTHTHARDARVAILRPRIDAYTNPAKKMQFGTNHKILNMIPPEYKSTPSLHLEGV